MALADSFNGCHFHEPYLAIQTHKQIIHIIPDICAKVYVTSKRIPKISKLVQDLPANIFTDSFRVKCLSFRCSKLSVLAVFSA